jgi:pyruvate dehydrogenase E1 component
MEDGDPGETREWLEAFAASVEAGGHGRGAFLLQQLTERAREIGVNGHAAPFSAYRNTIGVE